MNRILRLKLSKTFIHTRIIWSSAFLLFASMSLCGQGTLKGVITDKSDNAPLIAATVTVAGTTIGTVTDYNGEYTLPLKAGSYTILVSYIGYGDQEQEVTIADDRTLELNVSLGAVAIMGEEAVITMQARGQLAAVNQQLRSNQIINVVSAERIRELPDANAAQAVSRLPGVHLDGSKVVIRGIQPKMNKVTINGVEMPGTDAEDRSTDLGMISANMLSGIEVYKTLTPDMDADAVGGVVNMRLREAAPGTHYTITAQGGYNPQEQYMGSTRLWGDVSKRFLDNKLGILLNMNYSKGQSGSDTYSNTYRNYANSTEFWDGDYLRTGINVYDSYNKNTTIGGSLVIDYKLRNGQITYSGLLTHSASDNTSNRDWMDWNNLYHQLTLDRTTSNRLIMNNSLRYEQRIGIVKVEASVSNVYLDSKEPVRYSFRFTQDRSQNFIADSVTENNIRGMGDWDFYDWINPASLNDFIGYTANWKPRDFNENQYLADIDVSVPWRIADNVDIKFKVGGKYKRKERKNDEQSLNYYYDCFEPTNNSIADWLTNTIGHSPVTSAFVLDQWQDKNYQPNEGYMNNEGARMYMVMDPAKTDEFFNQVDTDPLTSPIFSNTNMARNDYWGFENHMAGYVMAEINLGKRLTFIPGVRYEQVHNEYSANKVELRSMTNWFVLDTLTKPADHKNWLPHLHMRYSATDWLDIRVSYNKTLTRPDYQYAIPTIYYNLSDGLGEAGNPNIKPATSENIDANFTVYTRKLGLFTVGGFYKIMSDVFYMQESILKNIPDSTIVAEFPTEQYGSLANGTTDFYQNSPYDAVVKGLEMEWQSNFNWLPGAWSGLVLNANYTHVWSETKYMLHQIKFVVPPGGFLPVPTEADTFYTNRLLHQANDLGNISMGYDYKGFSARLSFRYQGNVISRVSSLPQLNEYTTEQYKFDFVVKQQIPLKYGTLEVFFNAINFTNVPYSRFVDYPVQVGGESTIQRKITNKRFSGRTFQLGVRFSY
jgi:TonB-dependent receptor